MRTKKPLGPSDLRILDLVERQGLSLREASAVLGINYPAASKAIRAARARREREERGQS